MNAQQPMVHMPGAVWAFLALAAVLAIWSLVRRVRRWGRRRDSAIRAAWLLQDAPAAVVRREIAPLEAQLEHLRPLAALFPDHADAEEGDHAGRR